MREKLKNHRLAVILLAALLTMAALMLLARLPALGSARTKSVTVQASDGIYDLTGIGDFSHTTVTLPPGLTYYPNVLLTPADADTAVPESTDRYDDLRAGYLSQRFLIELSGENVYALTVKVSGRHALRVYCNGQLAGLSGTPGAAKAETEVWENNLTCYVTPKDGKLDIVLQSAQFYHAKGGARLASLSLREAGNTDTGLTDQDKGFLVMGALLCAAALMLCVHLLSRRTRATLFFSLACLAMTLRECIQSQAWTAFPFFSGGASFMLEYLSMVLLTIFLSLYLGQYIAGGFLRIVQYAAIVVSGAYGLFVLFADSILYTSLLPYYQTLLVTCIVVGVAGLFWTMRRPTREQAVVLYGIAVFYLAAVGDIVMYSDILGDAALNAPVSEAAMLVFVLAQMVSLLLMNNRLVAEAREAERRLAAEKETLETLNRLKTEVLANVSHELKTPLTVISGHAQLSAAQLQGAEDGPVRDKMRLIASEADRLALMVGQVLDAARIEEGRVTLDKRLCRVDELIYQAVDAHFPIMNKNGNRLEIKVARDLPAVQADPGRITQVLVNLIANAVRHTKQGIITVGAESKEDFVTVSVTDTGSGIAPEDMSKLFTRFHSRAPGTGETGNGLGLYICRYLVEAHGGVITVESAVDRGTAVVFTLPAAPADAAPHPCPVVV